MYVSFAGTKNDTNNFNGVKDALTQVITITSIRFNIHPCHVIESRLNTKPYGNDTYCVSLAHKFKIGRLRSSGK